MEVSRVLIVEDDALSRMYAANIAETAGFAVVEASNADEAVRILQSRDDIQIVFTDIDMPGSMNGLALARTVRERWPAVQILVTSGHVPPASIDIPSGARFLPKPYIECEAIDLLRDLTARAPPRPVTSTRRVSRNHDEKAGKAMTVFTVDMPEALTNGISDARAAFNVSLKKLTDENGNAIDNPASFASDDDFFAARAIDMVQSWTTSRVVLTAAQLDWPREV